MIFPILLILKNLLFMNITNISHNRLPIIILNALISLLVFSIIYFSGYKKKRRAGLIVYSLISIIMFADMMYYSFFNTLPSIIMLKQVGQAAAVGDSVIGLLSFKNLLFILDIPLLIIGYRKLGDLINIEKRNYTKEIRLGVPILLSFLLVFYLFNLNSRELLPPVSNQELYSYHTKDIKDTLVGEDIVESVGVFTEEDFKEIKDRSKLIDGKHTAIGKDKNLIVIQIEALQTFAINDFYEGQEVTPNLNALIQDKSSLYFDHYYQLIGRGNTSDAEFISNNSLHPSMEDPTYTQYEENTFYGLPWLLRDRGYNVWAFHGYEKEFWNREKAYVKQGYERFLSAEDYDPVEVSGLGITDEKFYEQSMDYLKELDSIDEDPFYAFIITLTSHTPFEIPEELRFLDINEEHEDTILGHYLQSIHYADWALGKFFEDLKAEGLYDDSVFALYGDHFGITAFEEETQEIMTDYLGFSYDMDEMFKIPLIITVPGEEIKETIYQVGSQLDFMPTILNIMGYENEKGLMFGRDLVNYNGYNFAAPQYYVLKGSFIDDEVMFQMSNDSLFENCLAKDLETRKEVEVESLRDRYEKIIGEINRSDYILRGDLIGEMVANDGQLDFTPEASSEILANKYIKNISENPIRGLSQAYDEEYRLFALDLEELEEEDELASWILDNPQAYILLRNRGNESMLMDFQKKYPALKDRLIVEIKEFRQFLNMTHRAYRNVFLNLSGTDYTECEIIDFLNKNKVAGVILDEKLGRSKLPKTLKAMNVHSYVEGVESKFKMKRLERREVHGFFLGGSK